jgi:hypothetical protein
MSDVLQLRAVMNTEKSLSEVVNTLRQIEETLRDNYTAGEFGRDVETYMSHIERMYRNLKIVGVVLKDQNRDPELAGIFVPLRIALQDQTIPEENKSDSILAALEQQPYLVLLGGPGSGKSTATRYLAWSHAVANLPSASSFSNAELLSGKPLPLRVELRRFSEDRQQCPHYDFLTYATEVMFKKRRSSYSSPDV